MTLEVALWLLFLPSTPTQSQLLFWLLCTVELIKNTMVALNFLVVMEGPGHAEAPCGSEGMLLLP